MFSVTALGCKRGQTLVLSNVSFSLAAGDCLILRGPNGSGKTTLLRTLAGLAPPATGTLTANSEDIVYAGHLDAIKPQLSVAENLSFWAQIYATPNAQETLAQTIETFALSDLIDRPAANLSAGQKRRLGLSRLAISARKIWLLDEPTTALDTTQVASFTALLNAHCKNGGIAIVSTHLDLELPTAKTLHLEPFRPAPTDTTDPFLEGFA